MGDLSVKWGTAFKALEEMQLFITMSFSNRPLNAEFFQRDGQFEKSGTFSNGAGYLVYGVLMKSSAIGSFSSCHSVISGFEREWRR